MVALNLGNVYISVRINEWNNAFYNALQKFDGGEFFRQLALFGVLASLYIVMAVYALYLNQMLQIRWRRWLTRSFCFSMRRPRRWTKAPSRNFILFCALLHGVRRL